MPVPGDYDGDGIDDIAVYNLGTKNWSFRGGEGVKYGRAGEIPVPADYDGNVITDIAMWDAEKGVWRVRGMKQWKLKTKVFDVPVPGDYDGDGAAEPAFYRFKNGCWYFENGKVKFGEREDIPLVRGR